jgi:hypothetical protein
VVELDGGMATAEAAAGPPAAATTVAAVPEGARPAPAGEPADTTTGATRVA